MFHKSAEMGTNFSTSGWIVCVLVIFYAQDSVAKSVLCRENQYFKDSRCCDKCPPGFRVFSHCTESQKTVCSKCNHHEYQPGLTEDMTCIAKKYCDPGKRFMSRNEKSESLEMEEPCRCKPGFQCHPINCEYCEEISNCGPGEELELDPGSTNGRKICVACKNGFYSAEKNKEPCKPWRNCKAEGRRETQPGSAQADATCGDPVPGATPSWVLVSVLSVITVLCLLILLLFCYKDKLKLLSVNLRSCVQNLKRSRIQQETLGPLYNSRTAAEGPGSPKYTPCEMTKLVCQAPHSFETDPLCTFPSSVSYTRVSLPSADGVAEKEGVMVRTVTEDDSKCSGEPEELSEEEVVKTSQFTEVPCVCVAPVREPLEVGENEDCSQAVIPGTPGTCSCGGHGREKDGADNGKEDRSDSERAGERSDQEKMGSPSSEICGTSLVSLSSPLIHTSSMILPSNVLPELCMPLSQAQVRPQVRSDFSDNSLIKQEEFYRLESTDSTSSENSAASAMTLVSALVTSTSAGDLYLDQPAETSGLEKGQGTSCRGNKLPLAESELECSPESLHSQLAEPSLNSGLVSGNHNTTFISSGQVMNVTGDVIVVYVSQTSQSSDEGSQDSAFRSPVQEEASETAPIFQSSLRFQGDSISHNTLEDETLPVQEMIEASLLGK